MLGCQPTSVSTSLVSVFVTALSNQDFCYTSTEWDMGIYTLWFPSDAQTIWSLAIHSEVFVVILNRITWSKEMIPSFLEASSLLHSWVRLLIISKEKIIQAKAYSQTDNHFW